MAFQLNQRAGLPAPAAHHTRQCGKQQVVDLGAIGGRREGQELASGLGIQGATDLFLQVLMQGTLGVIAGQIRGRRLPKLRLPAFQLRQEAWNGVLQPGRPGLIGGGLARQCWRCPLAQAGVQLLQIVQQDAPGHPVHHQVMDHQQQALAVIGHLHQQCAQQRAVLQVEAALGLITQLSQGFVTVYLALPQHGFTHRLAVVLLPPLSVRLVT
ncbi:hypothetical protein PSSY5922_23250 [Pseudomonas synxantha]